MASPLLTAVRDGYRAGLCLLPAVENGSKAPDVRTWRVFQTRRPTPSEMKAWNFGSRSGYGVIAGPVSGGLDVWDFDAGAAYTAFGERACRMGLDVVVAIANGYCDQTPRGGYRWLVRMPDGAVWQDCTLARRPRGDNDPPTPAVVTLIEMPTFNILAPSNGRVHPSGGAYVRVSGGFDTIVGYTLEQREALIELARSFDQMPRAEHRPAGTHVGSEDLKPGEDFNRRASWLALLGPAKWTPCYTRHDVTYWRRPGKDVGVSATTNYQGSDLFYPFSSSTIFDVEKSYSKFGVYAVLHHGGDYSAAARELARQGYGRRSASAPDPQESSGESSSTSTTAQPILIRLSEVEREQIEWIWPQRLARGKSTLIAGDPGCGKSALTIDLAAHITTGTPWPDGTPAVQGSVLLLACEDGLRDTVRGRVDDAGGDPSRVIALDGVQEMTGPRLVNLAKDVQVLAAAIDQVRPVLVVIDPITGFLGQTDFFRDNEVRTVLSPILQVIDRQRCALAVIAHLNKAEQRGALYRPSGSIGFVASARMAFVLAPDTDTPTRRLLVPLKQNICAPAPSLAFQWQDGRLTWEKDPVDITADTLLRSVSSTTRERQDDADDVIDQLLTDEAWPLDAAVALEAGCQHGVLDRTLRRAAHRRGIRIRKAGFEKGWVWHRPIVEHSHEGDT